jgi:glycosyltransferase involved in cell wall biosynthesis
MAEHRQPRANAKPERPSISVFFPAYNDGGTIPSMVLTALMTLRELTDDHEIIVVNDGSSDYTAEVLAELAARYPELRIIHHEQNRGYGGALRTGFGSASKDLIFYTDGDAQYDPRELTRCTGSLSAASTTGPSSWPLAFAYATWTAISASCDGRSLIRSNSSPTRA